VASGLAYFAFRVFEWLYRERFSSQDQLIELKESTIAHYKETNESLCARNEALELERGVLATHISHTKELQTVKDQQVKQLGISVAFSNMHFSEMKILFCHLMMLNLTRARLIELLGSRDPRLKLEDAARHHKTLDEAEQEIATTFHKIEAAARLPFEEMVSREMLLVEAPSLVPERISEVFHALPGETEEDPSQA
jgi:hypothetical protein